jgi:hypothetical protein
MQVTDLEDIKAALWEQSHHPCTQVKWAWRKSWQSGKVRKGICKHCFEDGGTGVLWKVSLLNDRSSAQLGHAILMAIDLNVRREMSIEIPDVEH